MTSQRNRIRHYLPIVGLVVATAGLEACLGDQRVDSNSGQERKIVLIAGAKSHGPTVHEYGKTVRLLKVMLDRAENVSGISTEAFPHGWPEDAAVLDDADLVVVVSDGQDGDLYSPAPFQASEDRVRQMERLVDRGGGFMTLHFSTFAPDSLGDQVLEWVGGYFDWQDESGSRNWYSAIQTLDTSVDLLAPEHPISRGLPASFRLEDEYYYNLRFKPDDSRLQPILRVPELMGEREHGGVVAWAVERVDGGRGFGTSTGHFFRNWENAEYRTLILNAIVWASGAEVPPDGVASRFYTNREVSRALYGASRNALILTGNHHPAHPWRETTPILKSILEADGAVHVDVSHNIEDLHHYDLRDYDFLLLNYANWEDPAGISEAAKESFIEYLTDGGGLIVLHFANGAFHFSLPQAGDSDWPEYRKIVRRVWDHTSDSGHDPYGSFRVEPTAIHHPITDGIQAFETSDELYFNQKGDEPIEPLLTASSLTTGRDEPIAWAYTYGEGRVFQTVLGHDAGSLSAPAVATLLRQAGSWVAGVAP